MKQPVWRRTRVFAAAGLLLASVTAQAGVTVGAGLEYFYWREYNDYDLTELLNETGVRKVVLVDLLKEMGRTGEFIARGRLYSGDVNYDGALMDGTPLQATTEYTGQALEVALGYRGYHRGVRSNMRVLTAVGIDNWRRDLVGPGGYEENYRVTFLRFGVESADQEHVNVRGGLLLPLDIAEHVDLYGGFDLEPKRKPWFYLGASYRFSNHAELGLDYQGYRLGNSDPVDVEVEGYGTASFYQPRSEHDTLGLTLRLQF